MAVTKVGHFAHRPLATLSGDERQHAWIAAVVLAQAPTMLYLDIGYQ